jgi:uncharacterized ferritin-like protein (DUF455 family)
MCGDEWNLIQANTEAEIGKESRAKYKTLNQKLDQLAKNQTKTPQNPHIFHPRRINNTNIRFSRGETALLSKFILLCLFDFLSYYNMSKHNFYVV